MIYMLKTLSIVSLLATTAFPLTVESVSVDSVWNSDSSWTDIKAVPQQRISRDCALSFKAIGEGTVRCSVSVSIDSGKSWNPKSVTLTVLGVGTTFPLPCKTKNKLKVRVIGPDRNNFAFRISAKQYVSIIESEPKGVLVGLESALTPGSSAAVKIGCKLNNYYALRGYAPLTMVYWDVLGDGSWDDSSTTLSWTWNTTVPPGTAGQRKTVIGKARDLNGLWTEPCSTTIQFGLARPLNMVSIPGGTFQMGGTATPDELPIRTVTISPFKMGATEVTQELYMAIMDTNPSVRTDPKYLFRPVVNANWLDAALFCNALSKIMGKDTAYIYSGTIFGASVTTNFSRNGFRLPTEAEWEYACKAGSSTDFYWGRNYPPTTPADTLAMDSYAVWSHTADIADTLNPNYGLQPVGTKKPNAFGLYDMTGNAMEWANDWYTLYAAGSPTDPPGPDGPLDYRVVRGGSWTFDGKSFCLRSAYRNFPALLGSRFPILGFRIVCRP